MPRIRLSPLATSHVVGEHIHEWATISLRGLFEDVLQNRLVVEAEILHLIWQYDA